MTALARDPLTTNLGARGEVLVRYAVKLTREPAAVSEADIAELREAGLDDRGIHDLACVAAYYNFVNRVALGLGVELESP